jgi:uncharacterized protein involved in high-affinity Fe2+ transport
MKAVDSDWQNRALNLRRLLILCYSFAILIIMFTGCGQGPPAAKRVKVEGKVTVNGQPVANGFIRFMALDPNGMNSSAAIKDGHYSVPAEQGPTKGKYRVEFNVPSAQKKRIPNDDVPGQLIEEAPETLPAKYHAKSTMVQEIDPDKPQVFDFSLTVP